jgi:hypothetical protein
VANRSRRSSAVNSAFPRFLHHPGARSLGGCRPTRARRRSATERRSAAPAKDVTRGLQLPHKVNQVVLFLRSELEFQDQIEEADALHRSLRGEIASFAVIVDAKDDAARRFYECESFLSLPDQPMKLFRPMADIAALFK